MTRGATSPLDDPRLAPLKVACVAAPFRVTLDAGQLRDVVEDPAFQRRLARGVLDVGAIAEALVHGKAARFTVELDGRGRDQTRHGLEKLRGDRPRAIRAKTTHLFRSLLAAHDELDGSTWQHAKDLLLTLLEDFPELALELPQEHKTGRPARSAAVPMVLTRRHAKDPSADIKKRTRVALKAAGLPDFLAGRALRAAGL